MPEGHLVHRYARTLRERFAGERVQVTSPQGRFGEGAAKVDGAVLATTEAFGKHLFLTFDGTQASTVHVHLGRQGTWLWVAADVTPRASVRMRIASDGDAADLIAPIVCEVGGSELRDAVVERLGPDPLRDDADTEVVLQAIAESGRPIGAILLDQAVVSGIGNVLRAEILNIVGIHPTVLGRDLTDDERERVWKVTSDVMRSAVDAGRIITRRLPGADATTLEEAEGRFVYGRERCGRCDTPLEQLEIAARAINACPTCQPRR